MTLQSHLVVTVFLFSLAANSYLVQGSASNEKLAAQAQREYIAGKFVDAERDFAELVKNDPSNIYAQVYLGQARFRQEKYTASIAPFETARELERNGSKLSLEQHRILVD